MIDQKILQPLARLLFNQRNSYQEVEKCINDALMNNCVPNKVYFDKLKEGMFRVGGDCLVIENPELKNCLKYVLVLKDMNNKTVGKFFLHAQSLFASEIYYGEKYGNYGKISKNERLLQQENEWLDLVAQTIVPALGADVTPIESQ